MPRQHSVPGAFGRNSNHQTPKQAGLKGEILISEHCAKQAIAKGFTKAQIRSAIRNPDKVTRVTRYPGQLRYCGAGAAVVMEGNEAVTVYADGKVTPLRDDQCDDPKALGSSRVNRRP